MLREATRPLPDEAPGGFADEVSNVISLLPYLFFTDFGGDDKARVDSCYFALKHMYVVQNAREIDPMIVCVQPTSCKRA